MPHICQLASTEADDDLGHAFSHWQLVCHPHRIKLPKGGVGRDYVLIQLIIDGAGPYDFMLDSGDSTGTQLRLP
jgi:hypothetical protein